MDLCSLLVAGEGLLVGSFAGGFFLVHSECAESAYINSRPFRVNAGPVRCGIAASSWAGTLFQETWSMKLSCLSLCR